MSWPGGSPRGGPRSPRAGRPGPRPRPPGPRPPPPRRRLPRRRPRGSAGRRSPGGPAGRRAPARGPARARLPRAAPPAAGAGRGPGHPARAGPRHSGPPRPGRPGWRPRRCAVAHAARRPQGPAAAARCPHRGPRWGDPKASVALGPWRRRRVDRLLTDGTPSAERGPAPAPGRREAAIRAGIRRLQARGLTVTVAPNPSPP